MHFASFFSDLHAFNFKDGSKMEIGGFEKMMLFILSHSRDSLIFCLLKYLDIINEKISS